MNKWCGKIGFTQTVKSETHPSVWEEEITERTYYGDIIKSKYRNERQTSTPNDSIKLSNQLSVVSDTFMYENFQYMKYITWMNSKWSIESVELQYPRVIIEIGGIYNA